jgi:hypothetical protein
MTIQLFASIVALVFSLLAFLTSPSLPIFAPLLTIGLLGIFVTTAPLCTLIYPLCMPSFDLGSSLLLTNQISPICHHAKVATLVACRCGEHVDSASANEACGSGLSDNYYAFVWGRAFPPYYWRHPRYHPRLSILMVVTGFSMHGAASRGSECV